MENIKIAAQKLAEAREEVVRLQQQKRLLELQIEEAEKHQRNTEIELQRSGIENGKLYVVELVGSNKFAFQELDGFLIFVDDIAVI